METQNQPKATHVLVPKQLYDLLYEYIINQPLKDVRQLEELMVKEVKLVALPEKNEKTNDELEVKPLKEDKTKEKPSKKDKNEK